MHRTERVISNQQQPIAIVGMACRFPRSRTIAEFWRLLEAGQNAVVHGPPGSVIGRVGHNIPDPNPGNVAVQFGAFVEDIDLFDAEFFRMSPLEAQLLDPQHRMMLETSWQALEDAAIDPEGLKGSRTGVYAGISNYDYRDIAIESPETSGVAAGLYAVTGNTFNTAIGRVSFALGLEGPSMAIDTACSSSLVAVHQAASALQQREVDLAIAGGVQIFLSGRSLELRANAGMLSPEGQCKTFDASADGFVCGEGCGLVVLKRLEDAEADGDRIWAVVRGTAVNQDGASQGLTVPSGQSQEHAIEEALARAGLSPSDTDYLEAHGTGTVVGDPIEVNAAASVYGRGRASRNPLLMGSVKTNIGHLGAAAGVAGLIKSVLAMRHGMIPQHLNFNNPNPRINWDKLPVRVTDTNTPWPPHPERRPIAGVNSFGWSGTNAHVVVEGYGDPVSSPGPGIISPPMGSNAAVGISLPISASLPAKDSLDSNDRETRLLPLSAKTPDALRDLASHYLSWLDSNLGNPYSEQSEALPSLADLTWTASSGRSHFLHRSAIVFSDVARLRNRLEEISDGIFEGEAPPPSEARKVAFVFTGQGSQWIGMGKALYEREPVFRAVLDQCDHLLTEERGISLLEVMFGHNGTDNLLNEPSWTQPAIYTLECGLTALWASVGIKPDVVVGHSLGEIAASQAAGVFTLEQGLKFASARGTLLGSTRSDGAMAAVFAPAARVSEVVAEHNATSGDVGLSVAVDNGLQQVVSGPSEDLETVLQIFEAEDVKVRRLKRSPAYHSALMEPALDDLAKAVRDIAGTPPAPAVPLISDLNGRPIEESVPMDASYWRRHAREPVAFRSCVETLAEMQVDTVVEIGPHAILGPVVSMTWPVSALGGAPVVLQSLLRPPRDLNEPVFDTSGGFVDAAAKAYESGLDLEFAGLFAGESRRKLSIPTYPFQRKHHWVSTTKRRQLTSDHPLLGTRHESPRGEVMYETEMFPSDPAWMVDHLVYDRIVAPGGMYGAMAVSAFLANGNGPAVVDEMQTYSALIFEDTDPDDLSRDIGRKLQFVLDSSEDALGHRFEIFSKGGNDDAWTLHAEGLLSKDQSSIEMTRPVDLDAIKSGLEPRSPADFYQMRSADAIYLGPSYHTLKAVWAREGESLGELALQDFVDGDGIEMHPLLLDGCFQVLSLARHLSGIEQDAVYMPFGWERLWVSGPMPERIICHATLRQPASANGTERVSTAPPEVITGDINFYSTDGQPIGGLKGFTVKRATRTALLPPKGDLKDILYEVVWREKPLAKEMPHAGFLTSPSTIATQCPPLSSYLADQGVDSDDRSDFLGDIEQLSRAYALSALENLGWQRKAGATLTLPDIQARLGIVDNHGRLLGRLLNMLCETGVLAPAGEGFIVKIGAEDPLPSPSHSNPESLADQLSIRHPHGINELGLLRRCGSYLAAILQGREDPLALLFSDEGPSASDLYLKAPASRAANEMLGDVVAASISSLPDNRPLRIIEVGAGTGSATSAVLAHLPSGRFEYTFTDISAGFFAQAEARLAEFGAAIEYKALNIENDPADQGFVSHGFDLVLAANVLHATRDLGETLAHCRDLLAPSGQLIALEGLQRRAYQDLTFGLLDGWWRFSDNYRDEHALATPDAWTRALTDTSFSDVEYIGPESLESTTTLGSSIIVARGPDEITFSPGIWVLAANRSIAANGLAESLSARGQTVILAAAEHPSPASSSANSYVTTAKINTTLRGEWKTLFGTLPKDLPLKGVVHMAALDGHGATASTEEMAEDVTAATASALALVQGIIDASVTPSDGVWFVTRGAQILGQDFIDRTTGDLSGATLWGFGKVMSGEMAHLHPKMIDLDPASDEAASAHIIDDLLAPDPETHVAYRGGLRHAARLVRGVADRRLTIPDGPEWGIGPEDPNAGLTTLRTKPRPKHALKPGEVRIAVESMGLNFADILLSLGVVEYDMEVGREAFGRIIETAEDVEDFSVGDPVVAVGFGTFSPEMVTNSVLAVPAPEGFSADALAGVATCFTTAELAFRLAALKAGERVLVHAGSGGVGLAAIQLARALGAEVFVTASSPKQPYLRSIGVKHIFDSRQTLFGRQILEATEGEGVHLVLNSLTGDGFIEASLSCLARDGRFVEIAKRNIYSVEEMSQARPDVYYQILDIDALKRANPETPAASLSRVLTQFSVGKLAPLPQTVWPLSEIRKAVDMMQDARHIGKNVFRMPPLARGSLRRDRTYLVTGGMGGIGCEVARWLADNGATTIVLNGRRDPDPSALDIISDLRSTGIDVRQEVADVTDFRAVDDMLSRIDESLPPLGGIIHSVGVLSDGVIENQTWERFEQVMWPKVLGAWQLHKATLDKDLDIFVMFSSVTGVVGNAGQSNHAAANAFLDQLAAHRRVLGFPAQSIAWGAWSGIGEAEEQRERIERQLASTGAGWITPSQGLKALDWLIRQDVTTSTVTAVDWSVLTEEDENPSPFFEDLLVKKSSQERKSGETAPSSGLMSTLLDSPDLQRQDLLSDFIRDELKGVMRLSSAPSASVSFFDLGMDSLMAVELRNRINRALAGGYTASNTVVFDFPSANALAVHLSGEIGALSHPAPTPDKPTPTPRPKVRRDEEPIAIVGMACRFPGAPDLDSFWRLLEGGGDAVTEGRQDSGSWDGVFGNPKAADSMFRRGAFIDDIDLFDSRFFQISPIEARTMDPQQRMLLETGWNALEDAGIDPEFLKGSRAGVFAGVGNSEYRDLLTSRGQDYSYAGTNDAIAVGRLSFTFGFEGPAFPVNLACASSLAAVHQAVVSLQRGEVDLALTGGVNAVLSTKVTGHLFDLGILSKDGQCRAFDAAADGFVRGEGCGMVVLKRLSDAEADGDRIWGMLLGSAVNQNGTSAGLMAPNGPAQKRVMEDSLARAGIDARDVDYLEAQGVGSEFGDPIELNAIADIYGERRALAYPLFVGSVKTNIGHLEWASGIASLIKVVLAMHKRLIPENLHFNTPSPHFDWENKALRVTSETTPWPLTPDRQPLAAVNSYGLSGANAHVVVSGYPQEGFHDRAGWPVGPALLTGTNDQGPPQITSQDTLGARKTRLLPLSGKTPKALRDLSSRYLAWLNDLGLQASSSTTVDHFGDMAWTAGIGRSHFPHRAGLVFTNLSSLREQLEYLSNGSINPDDQAPAEHKTVAFIYSGSAGDLIDIGIHLYETEPVVKTILDHCDEALRAQIGLSLLGVLRGDEDTATDPAARSAAAYALECSLTALWKTVGVVPNVVLGSGLGMVSAAQAAGAIALEDGLTFAIHAAGTTRNGDTSPLEGLALTPPTLTIISGSDGRVLPAGKDFEVSVLDFGSQSRIIKSTSAASLADLNVDTIVEIGSGSALAKSIHGSWPGPVDSQNNSRPPTVLSGLNAPSGDSVSYDGDARFMKAVAKAYEAGLDITFPALFTGESRRRVALPAYPFQRRRHWVDLPQDVSQPNG